MSGGEFDPASIEEDLSDELIHRLCALVEDEKKVNLSEKSLKNIRGYL